MGVVQAMVCSLHSRGPSLFLARFRGAFKRGGPSEPPVACSIKHNYSVWLSSRGSVFVGPMSAWPQRGPEMREVAPARFRKFSTPDPIEALVGLRNGLLPRHLTDAFARNGSEAACV